MPENKTLNVLLIAGDYDVIQSVQRALGSTRFQVQNSLNHRESHYMLSHNPYDMVIVDARMVDRHSGNITVQSVLTYKLPTLAFTLDEEAEQIAASYKLATIETLETSLVAQTISEFLGSFESHSSTTFVLPDLRDDPSYSQQIAEVNTLFNLSRSLTEVLDLSEVLNRVVEAARYLTTAEEGMILLPEGDELYIRARVGIDIDEARNFRVKTRDTLAGQVFQSGHPILIGERGPHKVKTEYFVNSLLYVPIILSNETIGVLGVNNRTHDGIFTEHHKQMLINLASFASIAIQNARIHHESLERNRLLERLVNASRALSISQPLPLALPHICKQLAKVIHVGHVEIMLWDKDSDYLWSQARLIQTGWSIGRGAVVELPPTIQLGILDRRFQWFFADNNDEMSDYLMEVGAQGVLIVPIYAERELLGVIRIFYQHRLDHSLSSEQFEHIQSYARQAVAELLNTGKRDVISDNLSRLTNQILEISGADWCDFLAPMGSTSSMSTMAIMGQAIWLDEDTAPQLSLKNFPDLKEKLIEQSHILCRRGDNIPCDAAFLQPNGLGIVLGVPMIWRGDTRGIIMLGDVTVNRQFAENEIQMAKALVGQTVTVLDNARLLHDLESSLDELRNAQKRLVQTARLSAMGELATVVAHQLNNPLTTIIADTELMLMDEPEESPRHDSLKAIVRTGKRAANVARRLLAIARPIDPDAEPDFIDVIDSLRGVTSLLQAHLDHARIGFRMELPSVSMPPVRAVKGRLDDIWLNLLMNAYDALLERPAAEIVVKVSYDNVAHQIMVEVIDNGPGIPEALQEKIFSPFFTTKTVGSGTGLGLHISKEIVENIGGRIEVESIPEQITRFVVYLPVL